MSYRTFKRVLGETSLERKCRFLFGGGLLLLITASFYFYARLNLGVVYDQYNERADLLITANLGAKHISPQLQSGDRVFPIPDVLQFAETFKLPNQSELAWQFISVDEEGGTSGPSVVAEAEALRELTCAAEELDVEQRIADPPSWHYDDAEAGKYVYFRAIVAAESCLKCHRQMQPQMQAGDLIGVAKISFPLEATEHEIAKNNAILIATAIVTCFLAMLGAYAIVRYVIVKPVLHLKEVSEADRPGGPRPAGRHPHRRRIRGTQARLQPHAAAPGHRCRTSCGR